MKKMYVLTDGKHLYDRRVATEAEVVGLNEQEVRKAAFYDRPLRTWKPELDALNDLQGTIRGTASLEG